MGTLSSPAQCLLSHRTRSLLPLAGQLLQPKVVPNVIQKLQTRKHKKAIYYDRGAKELHPLEKGDVETVLLLPGRSKWFKAQVEDQVAVRSYNVHTEDGRVYRYNSSHLYKVPEKYMYQAFLYDEAGKSDRSS